MTKEEAIRILENALYGGGNFFTMSSFKEAIELALGTLKQVSVPKNKETGTQEPSLPANVDEAAHHSAVMVLNSPAFLPNTPFSEILKILDGLFKAGAEWMAGQGETIEGTLGYGPHLQRPIIMLEGVPKFYDGHSQEVIVQIRKV